MAHKRKNEDEEQPEPLRPGKMVGFQVIVLPKERTAEGSLAPGGFAIYALDDNGRLWGRKLGDEGEFHQVIG